jgi:TonB family protein
MQKRDTAPAVRLGVIQGGQLVEERLLRAPSITVGQTQWSTVILPGGTRRGRWRLFDRRGGRPRVRLAPGMAGRIATGGEVVSMAAEARPRVVVLPERARGRIAVADDVVILFQLVTLPDVPRPQLPSSLRRSTARDLDRPFAALAVVSLLAHLGLVLYLRGVDWPRRPDIAEVPDRFVRIAPRLRPPPPPPRPAVALAPTPAPPAAPRPRPARPEVSPASIEETRRRLIARVGRKGILQVLSALGPDGNARDLLRHGSIDQEQERAMRDVGGLVVAHEGMPLPLGTGVPTGAGRVADVRSLQGQAHISVADVGGPAAERRVPLVRSEPPTLDEPIAGFDPRLVARGVRDHLAEVRACYERALKRRGDLGGKLVLRFTLTPAGTVAAVDVDEDTLGDAGVIACVRQAVMRWRFPAPPRRVEVTFPFVFQPAS